MSISIPQPFVTHVAVAQPFRVRAEGIPSAYTVGITDLPTLHLSVDDIPHIQVGLDPIELRLTEIPSVRTHLPADFAVGFSLWGMEIGSVRICGEAQVITEPYRPNPCEVCGPRVQIQPGEPAAGVPALKAEVQNGTPD